MAFGTYKRTKKHIRQSLINFSKKKDFFGKNHPLWKGDDVGRPALHTWISRCKGKPKKCEECGIENKKFYDWANLSGLYKRDLNDYKRLCRHCHRVLDKKAKLNNKKVISIRKLYSSGKFTQRNLAKKFNVCQQVISTIITKKSWSHV